MISRVVRGYVLLSSTINCPGPKRLCDIVRTILNKRQVRLEMMPQRRGHAGDDHIAFAEPTRIDRRIERCPTMHIGNKRSPEMLEIILPAMQCIDLFLIDIEADNAKPRPMKRCHQRQADVTQPNHTNDRRARIDPLGQ